MPKEWAGTPPHRKYLDELTKLETDNFARLSAGPALTATDGSGGPASVPRATQRCGAGAAAIRAAEPPGEPVQIEEVALAASEVPGAQTVPRAELLADIIAT